MRFIRMVFGAPFFVVGVLLMFVATLIMGEETARRLTDEVGGFVDTITHE